MPLFPACLVGSTPLVLVPQDVPLDALEFAQLVVDGLRCHTELPSRGVRQPSDPLLHAAVELSSLADLGSGFPPLFAHLAPVPPHLRP